MNKRLVIPLIVLAILALSIIPAMAFKVSAQQAGQPVTEITWKVRLNRDAAILEVSQGGAGVFAWSSPLTQYQGLNPKVLGKMKLIRSTSTYVDIGINPAANIIDPNAPGVVQLKGKNLTGQQIPGLIYWDSPKYFNSNWVNITQIKDWKNVHFNPFGLKEVRFALNFLINRDLIVRRIYGGSAAPALGCIRPSMGEAYERLKQVYDQLGLTPTGDSQKAVKLFNNAMTKANQVLKKYGFALVLKTDSSSPTGKFWYLKKPDGSEEPITIYFLIRVEDERLEVGRQISTWMEQYWNLKVQRIERERSVVTPVIYGKNLVSTSSTLGGIVWTLYTEGWVTMSEQPAVWARYDIAFFYMPLWGYGSNTMFSQWWYWYNATLYNWGTQLNYGSFTPETVNRLWTLMTKGLKAGVEESVRVFVTENWEFAPVNKERVTQLVPGTVTGIWTPWTLRTLKTVDGKATIDEFSSQGALFMSSWNPVLGFTDVYSMLMGQLIMDYGFYNSPITGNPVPIRVKSFSIKYNATVPNDAYIFNSTIKKWVAQNAGEKVGPDGTPIQEVILNLRMGKWHDGRPLTMADVIYWYGFYWDWSHDDSHGNYTDPYYDPDIDSSMSYSMSLIRGIKIINSTTIAVYISYLDVLPSLIAGQALIWPELPWTVNTAAEQLIVHGVVGTGQKLPYGWATREGTSTGISLIDPTQAQDVKNELIKLKNENFIPDYITTYPQSLGATSSCYQYAINFIGEYNHAMISNGPYYVVSYNPSSHVLVMKWFKDYVYPPGYWNTKFELYQPAFLGWSTPPPAIIIPGTSYSWQLAVKLYRIMPTYAAIDPTDAVIYGKLYRVVVNKTTGQSKPVYTADLPENAISLVSPGIYKVSLSTDFTSKNMAEPGTYLLEFIIGHPKSGITVIKYLELTSTGTLTTTTTTAPPPTTTTTTTTAPPPTTTTTTTTAPPPSSVTVTGVTVTLTQYKTLTMSTTKTVGVPQLTTVTQTTTSLQTKIATNWGLLTVIAIITFIIGIPVGYVLKRK